MKLVIAGKNSIAVDVLKHVLENTNFDVYVILNKNENFKNSFQKSLGFFSKKWNVKIVSLEEIYKLKNLIFLSLEFDSIIKPNLFNSKKLYNIHFSLLPAYKGMYTSAHPILNNENFSGVTFHKIDNGIDTGDIIFQKKIKISNTDTAKKLYNKYIRNGTSLIIDNFDKIINNSFTAVKQSHINASYYSKKSIDYSNLEIDYNKSAFEINNQLRAFSFYDYQLPKFKSFEIIKWKILNSKSNNKPSELIFDNKKNFIEISTIDYDMRLFYNLYNNLWEACKKNDFSSLSKLINLKNIDLEFKTKEGWTALIISVYNSSIECVKLLIKNGANINAKNYNNTTVLMYAISSPFLKNKLKIIELLIINKVDLHAKDYYGKDVFDWSKNNKAVLELLNR